MKKYLKKSLTLLLAISVWCSAIPAWAMETQYEENNEIVSETSGDVEGIVSETGGDAEELSENMEQEMISEDAVIEEAEALETDTVLDLNYIYVESPYLETPGTENIVVSLGDGTENISEVKILGYRDNGETFECESTLRADELYLFSKDFYDETETGIYSVERITYKIEDVEKQIVLSDVGAVAEFGVNQEYEGYTEAVRATNEVNVGNDSVPVVAVLSDDGTAEVENSIAEALETVAGDVVGNESNGDDLQRSTGNELVIAIDPGHDVGDAGAAYNGLREETLTLEIAQYCKKELETYAGVRVHMTRTSSACPYGLAAGGSHAGTCIRSRVRDAAKAGAVIFVSLHLNAAISSGAKGAEIIIPNTSWKPEHNTEGKALAEKILSELTALGLYNRGYYFKDATDGDKYDNGQIADYFTVQNAGKDYNLPGIIVEHAFISNVGATDQTLLSTAAGRKKLGVADATGIAKYLGLRKGQWIQDGEKWYWKENNQIYKNTWLKLGKSWYWLTADGSRATGLIDIAGTKYYFDKNGVMQTGLQTINGKKYYFNSSGGMLKGWIKDVQKWYYADSSGVIQTGWKTIEGKKYYFNSDGTLQTGWVQDADTKKWMYIREGHSYATGWQHIGNDWYYFDKSTSYMQTGWLTLGNYKYYLNGNGQMRTGLQKIEGKLYYFDIGGPMLKNRWMTINGKKYYFTSDGTAAVGKVIINGQAYVFGNDGVLINNVTHSNGWVQTNGIYYYYKNGVPVTGWQYIGTDYYYFDKAGQMQTGWLTLGNYKYYLNGSGQMLTGLQKIDGKKYYFDAGGPMLKNRWITVGGKKYYFTSDGTAAIGKVEIGGKKYFFGDDGVLANSGWVLSSGKYYYLKGGMFVTGWQYIGRDYYYFDKAGQMQTGWLTLGNYKYYLNGSGQMVTGLQKIGDKKYYFDAGGPMLKNRWITVGGKKYYFTSDGTAATGKVEIGGKEYFFGDDGVLASSGWVLSSGKYYYLKGGVFATGWQYIGRDYYYFDKTGQMQTGWLVLGKYKYYLNGSGQMLTGWNRIDGKWYYMDKGGPILHGWQLIGKEYYYLDENGEMVTGWYKIQGVYYYFSNSGEWIKNPPTAPPIDEMTLIAGKTDKNILNKMIAYYKKSGATYPEYYKNAKGAEEATTLEKFCRIYYEEAVAQGIRADVAFCQAMKETGWLRFKGDVKIEQYNFAGIGATGGVPGNSFKTVREGIRAHIQHLHAYATYEEDKLVYDCVDPRYKYVKRGSAPYVEWLGIKENPNGAGWASAKNYGIDIMKMVKELLQ